MINNPKDIKELIDTFSEVPGQIIKKSIKEVLAEDKEKGEKIMIIVSQNKTELINFSNIVRLAVSNNAEGQALIEVHNFCDDFETVIGLYKTEERAKEVLQEIIEQYEYCQVLQEGHGISLSSGNNYVYAMPEK